jgi:hypothetical protein
VSNTEGIYVTNNPDHFMDENGKPEDIYGNPVVPYHTRRQVEHGVNCPKVEHTDPSKFIHPPDLDGPYPIGHVNYCGRCHERLP